ncbi:hypothetical protein PSN45_001713 [Yamadazyma tenuis]|uniref:MFS general substrate transporter n=1 Tax=Candida tenuis (strain ATCC 10573 / BCRC 21748 / CBS 615 / JCM 9827 / NBRC 10315 / NRRL Y-1498 / VKM Y-70) TaxID=590646 RepID=G3BEE9_CANTC|nr:MFS general substrate transporter [Yamadazyma tenuis ATCC 10573]EGV60528.1 MFS general substrate transporter [Yamadazyma tenuis ATCC 10573]WEJ94231.1 hypothetical protein PSN45_001713 [Yamadazyma tenuis]
MTSVISIHSQLVEDHNQHVVHPPTFTSRAIKKYLKTRFTTLVASKKERSSYTWGQYFNPFRPLGELNRRQWMYFFIGYFAWTWDAFDFFSVSLNVDSIAIDLGKEVKDITWGITLVLMLRSVGAAIFGLIGDRYGTKLPYVVSLGLLVVLQIGCGFVKTYKQFLGVRALFGIAMGGVYSVALGTCYGCNPEPVKDLNQDYLSTINHDEVGISKNARGILGGLFQQGYAFGYLLVVVFNRAIVDNVNNDHNQAWRSIFWFSAGPPVIFIVWRLMLPETDDYLIKRAKMELRKRKIAEGNADPTAGPIQPTVREEIAEFVISGKKVLKTYWAMFLYTILLMAGFNFFSHGSQDIYPTLLKVQLGYGTDRATVTNSVANLGAIFGGFIFGHVSNFIGRRISIIIAAVLAGAMIYPWAFIKGSGINAGAFFLQAGVQGAWGVVPSHLSELSPPDYRTFVVGLSYQLGNLVSSASSTIESTIGERFPIVAPSGAPTYNYAKVMAIFLGCVVGYLIVVTLFGPENRNASFDIDRDEYVEEFDDHGIKSDEESLDEDHDNFSVTKPIEANVEKV